MAERDAAQPTKLIACLEFYSKEFASFDALAISEKKDVTLGLNEIYFSYVVTITNNQ